MNAGEAVHLIAGQLEAAGIDTTRLDARLLVAHAMGVEPERIFGYPETLLSDEQHRRLIESTNRRIGREPLARIIGEKEFWSLTFRISDETLVPRPETETVVECVLDHFPDKGARFRVLDLGTGSGCLLLALLHEFPNARGHGIDMSDDALRTAGLNARHLGIGTRVQFQKNDWCMGLEKSFPDGFDLIVSNPPYIPDDDIPVLEPEVATFEPLAALAGGKDGLDAYRNLVVAGGELLAPDGMLAFEVGWDQAKIVRDLGCEAGLEPVEIRKDLAGIARCVLFTREKDSVK